MKHRSQRSAWLALKSVTLSIISATEPTASAAVTASMSDYGPRVKERRSANATGESRSNVSRRTDISRSPRTRSRRGIGSNSAWGLLDDPLSPQRRAWSVAAQFGRVEPSGGQSVEQSFGLSEVERIEAFDEPAIGRREQFARLFPLPLIAPQPRHAHRGAQLEQARAE